MKKLLAILLSALLLCAMIPFATVSAADEPTIVVSTLEANAGDEIQVEVKLLNNPGVIAATVEILYDKNVMELLTYYDEDEEMDVSQIEVASGWSAKYITLGPVGKCIVSYINGTASKNVTKEDFFTATFKIKEDAPSGTYPLTVSYDPQNFFAMGFADVNFGKQDGSVTIHGNEPAAIPGDADGNGKVNNKDLGMLQQHLNDWPVTINTDAMDVNKDGRINNKDLGMLQQYLNDWDVTLG